MAQLNDLGIDLGTSNVLIYQQGKGLVLRRPAVVAIERSTKKVLAIGDDAQRMVGRTPSNIMAIRPLKQGTVADFELTNTMLRFFLNGVLSKRLFSGPRVVMSVPSGVTETEKHSLINILLDAGVKRTYLLDRPLAAALGVGMDLRQRYGRMIVDMGAGITDIAVISEGEIVQSSSVYYAGDYFDDAIVRYIRKKYSLLIGERTAEQIKINIGTAMKPETDEANLAMPVVGRNQLSGLPRTQEIHACPKRFTPPCTSPAASPTTRRPALFSAAALPWKTPAPTLPCSTTAARASSACKQLYTESTPCFFPEAERHGALFYPLRNKKCSWFSLQNQMNSNEIKRN